MPHLVAPSLLSADFSHLAEAVALVNDSEADWFHLDVMDGVFVPNISFGIPVVSAIKKHAHKLLDVHLMIVQPERYIHSFRDAGADILTVHLEASPHLHRTLQAIRAAGMQAGIAINPHTPVSALEEAIVGTDLICVMSVNPGFGGQKFIENTYEKILQLKRLISEKEVTVKIEVDGGVGPENAKKLVKCGADVLVAGNSVFASDDPVLTITRLKNCITTESPRHNPTGN